MDSNSEIGRYKNLNETQYIPGNGILVPGQYLIPGKLMHLALIPPTPEYKKKETLDFLIDTLIVPFAKSDQKIKRVHNLLSNLDGLEVDTILCLNYSLKEGNFDEAMILFNDFYSKALSKIDIIPLLRGTSEPIFEFYNDIYSFFESNSYRGFLNVE